jgi:regulator of protease activity HflC (stomatin/prohibitin superfamily)
MSIVDYAALGVIVLITLIVLTSGARIVRPTQRGLVESLGKYRTFSSSGFHWIIPFIDHMIKVNITETMVNVERQEIITRDKLNATVAAQIYYKIKTDEESVKASQYNVNNVREQIVALAQTTLRNIIGTLTLTEANSDRNKINSDLMQTLIKETASWGIEVVRTELREINPPPDVQDTMNKVVKAENEKTAAVDFATATVTKADGEKRAAIKKAEGEKQAAILSAEAIKEATILEADGKAEAIRKVNEAAQKHFVGNAQILKQLEVTENSIKSNTLIIAEKDQSLVNVIGKISGTQLIPLAKSSQNSKNKSDTQEK